MKKIGIIILILVLSSCSTLKNSRSTQRDGSSFDKAIIVNNIPEEYKYVLKECHGCQMLGQALVYDKDEKPYDILKLKKPNGEEVSYYFDISKFFGKDF